MLKLAPDVTGNVQENEQGEVEPTMPDRRSNDWRDPKFYITLSLFLITLVTIFWQRAGKEKEVDINVGQFLRKQDEVLDQLKGINGKLEAMALSNNTLKNEMDSIKEDIRELKGSDGELKAHIDVLRQQNAELKARTDLLRR